MVCLGYRRKFVADINLKAPPPHSISLFLSLSLPTNAGKGDFYLEMRPFLVGLISSMPQIPEA